MKTFPDLVVCEHCDTVYRRLDLPDGDAAQCTVCDATLFQSSRLNIDSLLALTLTAAVAYIIANAYPIISISLQGLYSQATLWQAAMALAQGPIALIAIPTAMTIIIVPLLQILVLGWVLAYARAGRRAPGFATAMRLLRLLKPWSMIEVGLIGILVAIIKLVSMVQVTPGAGIWAMAALMVLITLLASRDLHELWSLPSRESTT